MNSKVMAQSHYLLVWKAGPEIIKRFSCSTRFSIKFFLLINVKMPTIVKIALSAYLSLKKGKFHDIFMLMSI